MVIGTNSIDLKRGKPLFDNSRKRNAQIELHIKDISQLNTISEMIEALRSMILHQGEEVAQTVSYGTFKTIKSLQKAGELSNYCDETTGAIDFDCIPEDKKVPIG